MSKFNKLLGAYLQELGESIADSSQPLDNSQVTVILKFIQEVESCKKHENHESNKKEDMSPEECLACELMNMLGVGENILSNPGEHISSTKPTVKIKIKKVSSTDDLNKILKELKNGGNIDLNTMNNSLGDIFDLNTIQEIMETPMFKQGGQINNSEVTLEEFLNE